MAEATFEMPPKLPVWNTVVQSYVLTFKNLGWFVQMAWVWIVLFVAALAAIYWVSWPYQQVAKASGKFIWGEFLGPIPVSLLVGSSIAVAWHRRLLLGEDVASSAYLRIDRTVLIYFLWGALFTLFWLVPILLTISVIDGLSQNAAPQASIDSTANSDTVVSNDEVPGFGTSPVELLLAAGFTIAILFGGTIAFSILFYIPTRLSLILPALALGRQKFAAGDSWRITSGNFWRLYIGTALAVALPLSSVLLSMIFLGFSEISSTRIWYVFDGCLTEVISLVIGMTGITFLSLAYRHFVGMNEPSQM